MLIHNNFQSPQHIARIKVASYQFKRKIVMKSSFFSDMSLMEENGYFSASNFRSNQVDLVVEKEEEFTQISIHLDALGFTINRSKCLDSLFMSVSEDPEETAIVIIFVDCHNSRILASYFRLLKMIEYSFPILILKSEIDKISNTHSQKLYRDCVHEFFCATSILSKQISSAVHASLAWTSKIDNLHASSIKYLEKGPEVTGKTDSDGR